MEKFSLQNKIAIVTGASMGIGEATARLFAKNGAKVALVARSKEKLEKVSEELPDSSVFVCDMSNEKEVRKQRNKKVEDGVFSIEEEKYGNK